MLLLLLLWLYISRKQWGIRYRPALDRVAQPSTHTNHELQLWYHTKQRLFWVFHTLIYFRILTVHFISPKYLIKLSKDWYTLNAGNQHPTSNVRFLPRTWNCRTLFAKLCVRVQQFRQPKRLIKPFGFSSLLYRSIACLIEHNNWKLTGINENPYCHSSILSNSD